MRRLPDTLSLMHQTKIVATAIASFYSLLKQRILDMSEVGTIISQGAEAVRHAFVFMSGLMFRYSEFTFRRLGANLVSLNSVLVNSIVFQFSMRSLQNRD